MNDAPHVNAAFINAIAEEGTKAEAVEYLQKQWNENWVLKDKIRALHTDIKGWKEFYAEDTLKKANDALRAEIERQRQTIMELNYQVKNSEAIALRAEVERLKEINKEIASIARHAFVEDHLKVVNDLLDTNEQLSARIAELEGRLRDIALKAMPILEMLELDGDWTMEAQAEMSDFRAALDKKP